jgi:muconolactone D-isomerase
MSDGPTALWVCTQAADSGGSQVEYLVTMTTQVPDGTTEEAVEEIRRREAVRSSQLASQGHLLRLWRPPLQPGEWRTLGLFAAADADELEAVLASMPLRVWRSDQVLPLSNHPNDPRAGTVVHNQKERADIRLYCRRCGRIAGRCDRFWWART